MAWIRKVTGDEMKPNAGYILGKIPEAFAGVGERKRRGSRSQGQPQVLAPSNWKGRGAIN